MTGQHLNVSRVRHALVAFALVGGTMAAVAGTSQSASADSSDQLVVVDVTSADSGDFSASCAQDRQRRRHQVVRRSRSTCPSADAGTGQRLRASAATPTATGPWRAASTATTSRSPDTTTRRERPVRSRATTAVKPKDTKTADSADGPGVQRMVARIGERRRGRHLHAPRHIRSDEAHPRGVATNNGSSFYVSGNNASADTGVFTVPFGGGTKTPIAGVVDFAGRADRRPDEHAQASDLTSGDLFTISEKATLAGLGKVGSGAPTTKSAITRLGAASSTADSSGARRAGHARRQQRRRRYRHRIRGGRHATTTALTTRSASTANDGSSWTHQRHQARRLPVPHRPRERRRRCSCSPARAPASATPS